MFKALSIIAIAPVLDEEYKIGEVVKRTPRDVVDEVLVVDDGSRDHSPEVARSLGATVIELNETIGVGAAITRGYQYAVEKGYDVAVVMAGNNKDSPEEIPDLLRPIAEGNADFVQGSRYLKAGATFGEMPRYRKIATRLHPWLFSKVAGTRVTDSTNGFRAIRRTVLEDPRIDITQEWLREYEMEPYLYLKAIELYRTVEVPVSKVYPPKHLGQTKMKPITGWWSMLRPLVLVGLNIKH